MYMGYLAKAYNVLLTRADEFLRLLFFHIYYLYLSIKQLQELSVAVLSVNRD
jgi:hypothetical protein